MAGVPKDEITERVNEAARILELTKHLDRKPGKLSGGQRQRVAMGRAIVRKPQAFLMDEPLSNLDAKLRVQMRAEVVKLQRSLGVTTIYVTHDQVEAMTMGDRVTVLKAGRLQQIDTPQNLYARPANVFVAAFIGSPSMNLYEASLEGAEVRFGSQVIALPDAVFASRPGLRAYSGRKLIVGIRPEDIDDAAVTDKRGYAELAASVTLVEALGAETMVHLALDAPWVDAEDPDAVVEGGAQRTAVGRFSPRTQLRAGDRARLAVSAENLHFFDPNTRNSVW
jgi:multiple sugar transport system ATP-binding protein